MEETQGAIYDLLTSNATDPQRIICETSLPDLSLMLSNDINNQLTTLLQAATVHLQCQCCGLAIPVNVKLLVVLLPCSALFRL